MNAVLRQLSTAWETYGARFDARSTRERQLMLAAALAVVLLIADALWLAPAYRSWSAARQTLATAQQKDGAARAEMARAHDEGAAKERALRADVAALRERLRAGDAALRDDQASMVGPDRMVALLDQLLARHGSVRVREMKSLPRSDLLNVAVAPAAGASAATATDRPSLYRHGVELTLEGSFADLLSYTAALEAMPQRVLWGGMQFQVDQHPRALLTLRLYTLSMDANWLEI